MPDPNTTTPKPAADSAETPEDVATLYSWANLHGAKYRDFSASRAQAREEARLRAEEAAAAERRRQEEEAERRRQEEAQIAARQAAEAAEAARQAEAERLAEIARQAEVERQAVLAAQEAQRQAAQQRGWQSQPAEIYSAGYNPVPSVAAPGIPESFEYHPPQTAAEPAQETVREHSDFASRTDFASFESAQYRAAVQTPSAHQSPTQFLPELQRPVSPAPPSAFVERAPAQPTDFSRSGSPAPGASPWSVEWTNPAPPPASVFASPAEPVRIPRVRTLLSKCTCHRGDAYMPSPWLNPAMHNPEMHEDRESLEQTVRPAWLAPELPSARPAPPQTAPATPPRPVPMYAQSLSQGAYASQPPAPQAPHAVAVPANPDRANPDRPSPDRPNPQQAPTTAPIQIPSAPPSYVVPGDDVHTGGSSRIASRWFALKSVFDPQSAPVENAPAAPPARVPTLAVFSLAGGVGKTSLIAALGRALSSRGERVLLVDTAPYGLLPFFFGARDQRPGQLRTFNPPGASLEAPIQLVTLDPETPPADAHAADPNQPQNPSPSQPADRNLGPQSGLARPGSPPPQPHRQPHPHRSAHRLRRHHTPYPAPQPDDSRSRSHRT